MAASWRIGFTPGPGDPFWVQVEDAIYRTAQQAGVEIVPLDLTIPGPHSAEEQIAFVEEVLAQGLAALIMYTLRPRLMSHILDSGVAIVNLNETAMRHPLLVSPTGLYESGRLLGACLAERVPAGGRVVVVGGGYGAPFEDTGGSRIAGIRAALPPAAHLALHQIPCAFHDEQTGQQIQAGLAQLRGPIDALVGLSDYLVLTAAKIGRELGLLAPHAFVGGINGDPGALAAISVATMTATVETSALEFGQQTVALACQAAEGRPLPPHFSIAPRLVTVENLPAVALKKLLAIAELPDRLVGINRQEEQRRLTQLELSLEIHRRVGSILDPRRLSREVANLIRTQFAFDQVQLFLWSAPEQVLVLDQPVGDPPVTIRIPLAEAGLLAEGLRRGAPVFIPDTRRSYRFPPDPYWPATRSRVIVPIRVAGKQLGLLDLHSERPRPLSHQELAGLQSLADQLGIAMENARLYNEAQEARLAAEKADQLKTRLVANVSHELRTPLNIILGYSQSALGGVSAAAEPGGDQLSISRNDLRQIYQSGTHLVRLINDLLDLSRAEIDALDLAPEPIATRSFLEEAFRSMAAAAPARDHVTWCLELPVQLPPLEVDTVRLRQILLNLLSNAATFTEMGEIVLGAEVLPPHLHIWVRDTGCGIPLELQERIFEPFVTTAQAGHNRGGVGLGLAITRRLVALHGGAMTLESQPGQGSTFHLYLPLAGVLRSPPPDSAREPALLVISARDEPPPALATWVQRRQARLHRLSMLDDPEVLLQELRPAALAWDLADAGPDAWKLVKRFRAFREYFQAPLILYNDQRGVIPNAGLSMTNVLTKPADQQTLVEAIGALRPSDAHGPIVIVDDDTQTREFYASLVRREFAGFAVLTASNGTVALALVAQETPSLVILDLMMPEVDGFEVLAQLRGEPRTRHIPVLVISGRMLSLADIQRLDYAHVIVQSKEVLSEEETVGQLRQVLSGSDLLPQQTSRIVKQAVAYLHQHHAEPLSRRQIAEAVGVNKDYLSRIFHQELGLSPWEYLNRYRIVQAKALLAGTGMPITDVAGRVGFNDPNYFSRVFRNVLGRSPRAYRERPEEAPTPLPDPAIRSALC